MSMSVRATSLSIALGFAIIGCGTTVTLNSPLPADCEEGTVRTALGECEAPTRDDNGASDTEDTDDGFDTDFPTDTDTSADTDDTDTSDLYPTANSWWAAYGPEFCAAINTCAASSPTAPPWFPVMCDQYVVSEAPPLATCDYDPNEGLNCMLDVAVNGFTCNGVFAQQPASCEDVCREDVMPIP